ncbi:MAG TPA: aminodeoxychorismate lyase [Burkholderiales bacterium]|nr:aminodeoxychorismate lyase [Burkholderiales bacterium]
MLVNGEFADSVKANDRGLMYGDGVFRTLLIKRGIPEHWDRHYRMLSRDCDRIGIVPPAQETLTEELMRLGEGDCVAKIIVTRGPGKRGYLPEGSFEPTRIIMAGPIPEHAHRTEVSARFCNLRLSHQPELAGIKHLNRLENVLARMEWTDPHISEGLLLDMAGHVIEGTMSSLFLYSKGCLIAPDLASCGIDGVQRARVLEYSRESGLPLHIRSFGKDELLQAEEVFLVNSVIGLWQIVSIGERHWEKGEFCLKLREWLQ